MPANFPPAVSLPFDSDSTRPIVSSSALEAEPHVLFRYWRERTPVIEMKDGTCIVLRAADVQRLLTDPSTRQIDGAHYARLRGVPPGPLFDLLSESLLLSHGDVHRRRRAPMARPMAFRSVETIRDLVRSLAEELIDTFVDDGEADLMSRFAAPLPPLVMSHMLGLPPSDAPTFAGWVYQASQAFAPRRPDEDMDAMVSGAARLSRYIEQRLTDAAVAQRVQTGVVADLLDAVDQDELSLSEATSQLATLVIGGSDTTRAAMVVQVGLILANNGPWKQIGTDRALARAAVSEALRYEPAVASMPRFSVEDIPLDGAVIPAGRLLTLSTISAMRDPALFSDPETFAIDRQDHPRWHLVFGGGGHRCIGEALGRLELEEGLMALSRRLPDLRLAGPPPVLAGHSGIRRPSALRVAW